MNNSQMNNNVRGYASEHMHSNTPRISPLASELTTYAPMTGDDRYAVDVGGGGYGHHEPTCYMFNPTTVVYTNHHRHHHEPPQHQHPYHQRYHYHQQYQQHQQQQQQHAHHNFQQQMQRQSHQFRHHHPHQHPYQHQFQQHQYEAYAPMEAATVYTQRRASDEQQRFRRSANQTATDVEAADDTWARSASEGTRAVKPVDSLLNIYLNQEGIDRGYSQLILRELHDATEMNDEQLNQAAREIIHNSAASSSASDPESSQHQMPEVGMATATTTTSPLAHHNASSRQERVAPAPGSTASRQDENFGGVARYELNETNKGIGLI